MKFLTITELYHKELLNEIDLLKKRIIELEEELENGISQAVKEIVEEIDRKNVNDGIKLFKLLEEDSE